MNVRSLRIYVLKWGALVDSMRSYVLELISGLTYLPQFVSPAQQAALISAVDAEPWLGDLKRRVQHYGYKYDYRARRVEPSMYLGTLPEWAQVLAKRFSAEGYMAERADQMIVNEYLPGQGIARHVDCVPCFADTILSLSLGSACEMQFAHVKTKQRKSLLLEPGSLLVMQGEARHRWQHGIPARLSDVVDGVRQPRSRRISLTFRRVIIKPA